MVINEQRHFDTCFHCDGLPTTTGWALPEDSWTIRLYHSLPRYLPKGSILRLTYPKGKEFTTFQSCYSKVACARMFLFHGAPDMILTAKKMSRVCVSDSNESNDGCDDEIDSIIQVLTVYPLDNGSDSSEVDSVIEVADVKVPMAKVLPLPEKVGQLVAELHFIALAKIIRNFIKNERFIETVVVKGILVDKSNGIIKCKLNVKASTSIAPCPFMVHRIGSNGALNTQALCRCFQDLV